MVVWGTDGSTAILDKFDFRIALSKSMLLRRRASMRDKAGFPKRTISISLYIVPSSGCSSFAHSAFRNHMVSLKHWYVLRSKPQKEDVLCMEVSVRGHEVYYPTLNVQPVNPRSKSKRPFFPGYLFINVDLDEVGLSAFRWMPYSIGLVCFGGEPAIVHEALIQSLSRRVDELNQEGFSQKSAFQHGDPVRITEGPFMGYEAIFDEMISAGDRVKVLLEFLSGRHTRLELGASILEQV